MLKPRKRITKKEIKEDALVTTYVRVQKFIQHHGKYVNITVAVLVGIIVVSVFMIRSKRRAEMTASGKVGVAEYYYHTQNYSRAIPELTAILETYSGTRGAGSAVFMLANIHYETGEIEEAEKYYQLFVDKYENNDVFTASSLAGIAACYESREQFLEAAQHYERAGKKYPDLFSAPYHLKNAARCYLIAGEKEKAKNHYALILEKYPESDVKQEVEFLLASL